MIPLPLSKPRLLPCSGMSHSPRACGSHRRGCCSQEAMLWEQGARVLGCRGWGGPLPVTSRSVAYSQSCWAWPPAGEGWGLPSLREIATSVFTCRLTSETETCSDDSHTSLSKKPRPRICGGEDLATGRRLAPPGSCPVLHVPSWRLQETSCQGPTDGQSDTFRHSGCLVNPGEVPEHTHWQWLVSRHCGDLLVS